MLTLWSPAFAAGSAIPERFTCRGADHSPPLAWSGAPEGTQSFALIVDDPDAPDPAAPRRIWVHWVVWNIPADVSELGEGASPDGLPRGAREGRHDGGGIGYSGPCPPIGDHRYFHKLYALDTRLPTLDTGATKAELERAIGGHVLATAELVGMCAARAADGDEGAARR
ncbi:MAG TPA: YbhB/YbcL family Raf kinase inhibitor-like protein [Gemmatimonadales bacterium]|nr:YbhB/YbcL family Raf kinase inhibitor-like protein [Gemmatimonadales bacterium]